MYPPNLRLGKPDKLSKGAHSQTSYPWVQWGNTLDKRGTAEPQKERAGQRGGRKEREKEQSGDCGEHRVAVKYFTRIYPCCRKLADRHKAQDIS